MELSKDKQIERLQQENLAIAAQTQDFEKVIHILQTTFSSMKVEEVLQHIIEEVTELCQAQESSIILFDPTTGQAVKTLVRQEYSEIRIIDHFLNTLLSGWVLDHRKPFLTNDLTGTFGHKLIKKKYSDIISVLSVPLEQGGEIIGVISLMKLSGQEEFGERELKLVKTLAPCCAQFIKHARLHDTLFAENVRLRKEVTDKYSFHGIIGHSSKMQEVFALLESVIPTESRVLIEGESGTGKELIARVIHYNGPRQDRPFIPVDCGALPANLLESELFGYVKGAFTGAAQDRKGLFEEANGGTLFLDEIVNMVPEIQSKFLRAIQEGEIRPLGTNQIRKVDVRIIAAASGNLNTYLQSGKFRAELFYRLNIINISMPPLRERKEDIAVLANYFLSKSAKKYGRKITGYETDTISFLESHSWPGNIRELENIVERMVILSTGEAKHITPELLPKEIREPQPDATISTNRNPQSQDMKSMRDAHEKKMLLEGLEKNNWNQSSAAKYLGVHEKTVRDKMKKFGIKKSE